MENLARGVPSSNYDVDGRMGLHQDKDESAASSAPGLPVVSVSLGDTARFLFRGVKRRDPVEARPLESGDAFVFGVRRGCGTTACRASFRARRRWTAS